MQSKPLLPLSHPLLLPERQQAPTLSGRLYCLSSLNKMLFELAIYLSNKLLLKSVPYRA